MQTLSFKPDLNDALVRWEAFYQGAIIDRPLVCVTAPKKSGPMPRTPGYYECMYDPIEIVVEKAVRATEGIYYGGESIPSAWFSLGPHEIAAFCGAKIEFSSSSPETNWVIPFVKSWENGFSVKIDEESSAWKRCIDLYRAAAQAAEGKMLLCPPDLHTNLDLLADIRNPQQLCLDLIDVPKAIEKALQDTLCVFRKLWKEISINGSMETNGYFQGIYNREGAAVLCCDFSCMISPRLFKCTVAPVLEKEVSIVRNAIYHWDGPGALKHADAVFSLDGVYTISFVPTVGVATHLDYIDLYKKIQKIGKAVLFQGD